MPGYPIAVRKTFGNTYVFNKLSRHRYRELRLNSMLLPLGKYIVIESPSIVTRHGSVMASDAPLTNIRKGLSEKLPTFPPADKWYRCLKTSFSPSRV